MTLGTLVRRELLERRNQLVTSFIAILLGVAVVVSTRNISVYSEKAVARELDALGANILILPKSATVQDYYTADMLDARIPEEYVTTLALSDLRGLDNISPKLTIPLEFRGHRISLTGILPKSEFQAKAMWQGAGVFAPPPEGCGTVADVPAAFRPPVQETLTRQRVIEDLAPNEALVGADIATTLDLREGATIELLGRTFRITAVLPATGTVDDARVFAHLHEVQDAAGAGPVLSAIEIVGCCNEISGGLVERLNSLLPDAKVVTVTQIVDTQVRTNRMIARLSLVVLCIIVLVGGASIANYMYANVSERRREIGTLMALGAGSNVILRIFLAKALILGLAGGVFGYILGTLAAATLGPRIAGIPVMPMPILAVWAIAIAVCVALAASYLPARRAARLDPCTTLQEI